MKSETAPTSVAFVCSANLCRSLMAQAIFAAETRRRGLKFGVQSAGLHDFEGLLASREARLACDRHGTPMPKFVSTYFRHVDLSTAEHIFVMTKDQVATLANQANIPIDRIRLLGSLDPKKRGQEIDDPIGGNATAFDQCYERLRDCIANYLDNIDARK